MQSTLLYRLAAVDLDDTLLGADKRASAPNREAVRALRGRGLEVMLASGRAVASMVGHHHEFAAVEGRLGGVPGGSDRLHAPARPALML